MFKEVFFNKVLVRENMSSYKDLLLRHILTNPAYSQLASDLYIGRFPLEHWIETLETSDFINWKSNASSLNKRYCLLEELDRVTLPDHAVYRRVADANLFHQIELRDLDEPVDRGTNTYFIIRDDFSTRLDEVIFNELITKSGYEMSNQEANVISKTLAENCTIQFKLERRDNVPLGIENYCFPELTFVINDSSYYISNVTDIQTLLFLPSSSFLFFYLISHDFKMNENGIVIGVERKTDEPVTEIGSNGFVLKNSEVNVRRYLKYIACTVALFIHYLPVLENWFREHIIDQAHRLQEPNQS